MRKKLFKQVVALGLTITMVTTDIPYQWLGNGYAAESDEVTDETEVTTNEKDGVYILGEDEAKRDEYTKTFVRSDGLYTAVSYAMPIHYENEEGEYEEIDNTLKVYTDENGEKHYTNKANDFDVSFPENLGDNKEVRVSKDGYSVSFILNDMTDSTAIIDQDAKPEQAEALSEIDEEDREEIIEELENTADVDVSTETAPDVENPEVITETVEDINTNSGISYEEVFENTDIDYNLISKTLKESIVINERPKSIPEGGLRYTYTIKTEGVTATLNENNSIDFKDGKDVIFNMPSPYAYDSSYLISGDVAAELKETEDGYELTISPDSEWLMSEEVTYPVTVDPTVSTTQNTSVVSDAWSFSYAPDTVMGASTTMGVVYDMAGSLKRTGESYIKFSTLPYANTGNIINAVKLYVKTTEAATGDTYVSNVTSDWNESTVTYNTKPTKGEKIDYLQVATEGPEWLEYDITGQAVKWYNGETNYGVAIHNASLSSVYLYTSESGTSTCPYLEITYQDSKGASGSTSTKTTDMGRAGTAYVNDYTGNLTIIRDDIGIDGNIMPVNIQMVYNSYDDLNEGYEFGMSPVDTIYGLQTRTNYSQTIQYKTVSIGENTENYYEYTDATGRKIYFEEQEEATEADELYVDDTATGYELTVNSESLTDYTTLKIEDAEGLTYYFDSLGRLKKIAGDYPATGNVTATSNLDPLVNEPGVIRIDYPASGAYASKAAIEQITDGAGKIYKFVYDKETSGKKLQSIDYMGTGTTILKSVSYTYESHSSGFTTMAGVTYADGKSVTVGAVAGNYFDPAQIVNPDNSKYEFTYHINKVTGMKLYGTDGVAYQDITRERTAGAVKYTDSVTETVEILQFDNYGNVISAQDEKGNSYYGVYSQDSDTPNLLTGLSDKFKTSHNFVYYDDIVVSDGVEKNTGESHLNAGKQFKMPEDSTLTITASLTAGKTYTLSAYVKGKLYVPLSGAIIKNDSTYQYTDGEWRRVYMTFEPYNTGEMTITLRNGNGSNESCFDGIQLEEGELGHYNLVENGMFAESDRFLFDYKWEADDSSPGFISSSTVSSPISESSACLMGNYLNVAGAKQTIDISGKEGEEFTFGGWSMADAAPIRDARVWNIKAKVIRADGVDTTQFPEDSEYEVSFNPYTSDWQPVLSGFTTEYDYKSIEISIHYDYQCGHAYFVGIQLYRTPFVTNYNYDSEGDLTYTEEIISDSTDTQDESTEDTDDTDGSNPATSREKTTEDEYGRVTEQVSAEGVGNTYNYDEFDNVLTERITNGRVEIKTTNTYTGDGNYLISQTDELGNTISYEYDSLGNVSKITDEESNEIDYTYDSSENVTKVSQNVSDLSQGSTIENTYTYDNSDNLTKITHNGFDYTLSYNALNELVGVSTPKGNIITYNYTDVADGYNLESATYGNGQSIGYEYNEDGVLTGVSDGNSVLYKYYISPEGDVGAIIDAVNKIRTDYSYDNEGNYVTTQTSTDSTAYSNEYYTLYEDTETTQESEDTQEDNANTAGKYDFVQKVSDTTYITSHTLDRDSRDNGTNWEITEEESKDAREEIFYDDLGRVQGSVLYTIDKDASGNLIDDTQLQLLNTSYAYNDLPQYRTTNQTYSVNLRNDSGYSKILSYEYNKLGYIVRENGISYTYDEAGQLKRVDNPKRGTTTYRYDAGGNVVCVKSYAYTEGELGSPNNTIVYGYDEQWKDLLISYNGGSITYDAIGNPLTYYNGSTFTWSMGRQLAGVNTGSQTVSYTYNEEGLRMSKSESGGETTEYVYADGLLTAEITGSKHIYYRYNSDDEVIAMEYNDGTTTETYYYVKNLQGDIISILDSDGNEVVSYEYNEWGKTVEITGSHAETIGKINPFRYRSYYYDEETGFYYLQSRYYDANVGRFINADDSDVLGIESGSLLHYNLFHYCWNNSVNMTDNNGYLPWFVAAAVGGALFDTAVYLIGSAISGQKITWAGVGKAALTGAVTGVAFGVLGKGVKALTTVAKATKVGSKVFSLSSKAISKAVSNTSRLQHAFTRHARVFGFGNWNKTTAKQWECFIRGNLSNYTKKFSAKLGEDAVTGYYRYFNGQHIATYIYKSGKYKGLVATVVELSANQMTKYKLW